MPREVPVVKRGLCAVSTGEVCGAVPAMVSGSHAYVVALRSRAHRYHDRTTFMADFVAPDSRRWIASIEVSADYLRRYGEVPAIVILREYALEVARKHGWHLVRPSLHEHKPEVRHLALD